MDMGKAIKQWQKLSDERMEGMKEWREQNPEATLREVETHVRGMEKAKIVVAVTDGAEWEQGFSIFIVHKQNVFWTFPVRLTT
jgi:hypothetical protein